MKSISNLNSIMSNKEQNKEYSNKYFDKDSPLSVYMLCYPHLKLDEIEKKVDKYKRRTYNKWISGDTRNMSTSNMLDLAVKNSHYSSYELDILIVHKIENDFKEEIHSMYTLSMDIIEASSITTIHELTKNLELIEDIYGRRTKTTSEELSDETLYKNKINYTSDYSPR